MTLLPFPPPAPKVNQLTLVRSPLCELVNSRKTVCTPVTVDMLAVLLTQVCQPPVGDIAIVAIAGLERESRCTSTLPLIVAPDASRAVMLLPPEPKSMLL